MNGMNGVYRIFRDPDIPSWQFWRYKYTVDVGDYWIVGVTITLAGAHRLIERDKRELKGPRYKEGKKIYEE